MAMLAVLLGPLAILVAPVDGETWHHSIDPVRCDATATVELPRWTKWVKHQLGPSKSALARRRSAVRRG